jgi:predicted Zn-dependent peptidase
MLHHFFLQHYQGDFEIILSGQITSEIINVLEKYFGSTAQLTAAQPVYPAGDPTPDHRHRIVIEKPENLQSSIRVGKLLFTRNHPDFAKVKVVNTLLGGYFGSRLMRNIREDKGFTYGISSGIATFQETGYLVIGTDVKKEFTLQTLEEIYKEIDKLQREPVGDEELRTLKNYMAGHLLSSVDTPFALADKFKNIYLYGLDYDYYTHYLQTINHMDADIIQDTAKKYLQTDKMKEVIVGGLK